MTTLLDPARELVLRHFQFGVHRTYFTVHCISLFLFSLGLISASRPLVASKFSYPESSNENFTELRAANGYFGHISFEEILDAKNESHALHELLRRPEGWEKSWISYNFGTWAHSYCWVRHSRLTESALPSLLRMFDFNWITQVLARVAVLIAIGMRFFFSTVSGHFVCQRLSKDKGTRVAALLLSFTDLVWLTFATLMLCIQQESDKSIKWMMHMNLLLFGLFFLLHAGIYLSLHGAVMKRTILHYAQYICILVFAACLLPVYHGYTPFLQHTGKPCYVDVPRHLALLEYISISSVLVFLTTQYVEMENLVGVVSVTAVEYESYVVSDGTYSPWFASQIVPVRSKTVC